MWLGKALFLKGEDRREQALQEYREGVRVLAQSKAERRSPSMALFRWYLGKALLETGEVNKVLPGEQRHRARGGGAFVKQGFPNIELLAHKNKCPTTHTLLACT